MVHHEDRVEAGRLGRGGDVREALEEILLTYIREVEIGDLQA
jgi:hypothetical protein